MCIGRPNVDASMLHTHTSCHCAAAVQAPGSRQHGSRERSHGADEFPCNSPGMAGWLKCAAPAVLVVLLLWPAAEAADGYGVAVRAALSENITCPPKRRKNKPTAVLQPRR